MNKRVLITGGAKGLGASITKYFAKNGYDIIFTYYKSEDRARELKKILEREFDVKVEVIKANFLIDEDIESLIEQIEDIDVLINNAAYNDDDDIFAKDADAFLKTYRINAVAPFLLSKGLYEILKKKNGTIINIASTNGIDTMYPESIDYDASKAALINITKNLATAFAPHVRVNAIAPGWIDTPSTEDMERKFRESEENKILMHRFANPDEIAKLVYFVASDDASYMNGSTIRIDGGINHGNR